MRIFLPHGILRFASRHMGIPAKAAYSQRTIYLSACFSPLMGNPVIAIRGQRQKLEQVTPIGEMDSAIDDDFTVYGFSIG